MLTDRAIRASQLLVMLFLVGGVGVIWYSAEVISTEQRPASWSPLHAAAWAGDLERASGMLQVRPADVHLTDRAGVTLLHAAARSGNARLVRLLLDRGADLGAADGAGLTSLHYAAQFGHADAARTLLEHGADPNQPDHRGRRALHWAAIVNDAGVTSLLLEYKADIAAQDQEGLTPVRLALRCGRLEMARALLRTEPSSF